MAILLIQRLMTSPTSGDINSDFWTLAYQAIEWAIDQQPFLQGYLAVDSLWLYFTNKNVIGGGQPTLTGPSFVDETNINSVADLAEAGTR